MKTLVVVACVAAAVPSPARADCGCGSEVLATTLAAGKPEIILETDCGPLELHHITLLGGAGKRIPIAITATHRGYDRTIQQVIEPETALAPGSYTLAVGQHHKVALQVVAADKPTPPVWTSAPSVVEQRQVEFGCGPAKRVAIAGADARSALAFIELVDAKTKKQVTGYTRVDKSTISIGHGMCGGPFELAKGRAYTATISLLAPDQGTTSSSQTLSFTYAPK